MGWEPSTEGVVVEKFVPSLESLLSLGFEGESEMSREFCRDVPDAWGCSKSLCKKDCAHVSALIFKKHCQPCLLNVLF